MCWQFYINCRAKFACFVQSMSICALCFRFSVRRRVSMDGTRQSHVGEICIVDRRGPDMHDHNGPRLRSGGDEGHRVHARWTRLYASYYTRNRV
jgi:hypothetical protein